MAGASKFGGTENGADCSKCGGTVAVLFKTRNGTSLVHTYSRPTLCTSSKTIRKVLLNQVYHINEGNLRELSRSLKILEESQRSA